MFKKIKDHWEYLFIAKPFWAVAIGSVIMMISIAIALGLLLLAFVVLMMP
jgi:uncharacterized membrane protein